MDDVLTKTDVAIKFKTSEKHIVALARRGEIPARKIGRDWRFKESELVKWFENWQANTFNPNERAREIIDELNGKKKKRI